MIVNLDMESERVKKVRRPLVYIPSQYSVAATTASGSYLELGEGVGMKRKYDEDADAASIDELRESLLNTCISKLTAASRLRRRRTLRHTVLINNLLRSLEHPASRPPSGELLNHRARITARRRSSDSHPTTMRYGSCESMTSTPDKPSASSSVPTIKKEQMLSSSWKWQQSPDHLSLPWELQQPPEPLPSCGMDSSEVMSSPTATFSPLLPVDLTSGSITPLSNLDASQSVAELEMLDADVGQDCSSCNIDVNFFEPPTFHKTAILDEISFASSDMSALVGVLGNKETHRMTSGPCKMFSSGLDPMTVRVPVEC